MHGMELRGGLSIQTCSEIVKLERVMFDRPVGPLSDCLTGQFTLALTESTKPEAESIAGPRAGSLCTTPPSRVLPRPPDMLSERRLAFVAHLLEF